MLGKTAAKLMQKFRNWAEVTTVHGVQDIIEARLPCKFVLGFFVGGGFCISLVQSIQIFGYFLAEPNYVTQVRYATNDEGPEFPKVVVCNKNAVNLTKAREYNMSDELVTALLVTLDSYTVVSLWPIARDIRFRPYLERVQREWDQFYTDEKSPFPKDSVGLLKLLGHDCESTFVECVRAQTTVFDCCKYAHPVVTAQYGLCWAVRIPDPSNPNQTYHQSGDGMFGGISFVLDPGMKHYHNDVIIGNSVEEGLVVANPFQEFQPRYLAPFFVASGCHLRVQLSMRVTHVAENSMSFFEAPCQKNQPQLYYVKGQFSVEACEEECRTRHQQQLMRFPCMPPMEMKLPEESCNFTTLHAGIKRLMNSPWLQENVDTTDPEEMNRQCRVSCLPICNTFISQLSHTSTTFRSPSNRKRRLIQRFLDNEFGENSSSTLREYANGQLIELNMFYTTTRIESIEYREKVPFENLLSGIGGIFSFYLGVSVLTVIQTFYYMMPCSHVTKDLASHATVVEKF